MKKILSIFLCLALVIGFVPHMASAADSVTAGKLSDWSTLVAGDQIVLSYTHTDNKEYAMTKTLGGISTKYLPTTNDSTLADNILTVAGDTAIITLEAGSAAGQFKLKVGEDLYIYYSGSKNAVFTGAYDSENASQYEWTLKDGKITNVGTSARILQCNTSDKRYACYKGTQKDPTIYKVGYTPAACEHNMGHGELSATEHWDVCDDTCGQEVEGSRGTHDTNGTGGACSECGFKVIGTKAILAGDLALSLHNITDSGYPEDVEVTANGAALTGSVEGAKIVLTFAEYQGDLVIMSADGKLLGVEGGEISLSTAPTAWEIDGNKLKTEVGGEVKYLAYSNQHTSFGVYAEDKLTNHVSELTFVDNATYTYQLPQIPNSTIAQALAGELEDEFKVTGVITYIDKKNVYIQDSTGGICLRLTANASGITVGETVTAIGTLGNYNGLPQLNCDNAPTKLDEGALTLAPVHTTGDLTTLANSHLCQYVELTGMKVLLNGGSGIYLEDANGKTIKWHVAKKGEEVTHYDTITLKGVVGIYNGTLQIYNNAATEVTVTNPHDHAYDAWTVDDSAEPATHYQLCTTEGCGWRKADPCDGNLSLVATDPAGHYHDCDDCDYATEKTPHDFTGTPVPGTEGKHYVICPTCQAHSEEKPHEYGDTYKTNPDKTHYQECACGVKTANEACADADSNGYCDKCNNYLRCDHDVTEDKYDENNHWKQCMNTDCNQHLNETPHSFSDKSDATNHWSECACGAKKDVAAHTLEKKYDETNHWTECACGYASTKEAHTEPKNECACGYKPAPTEVVITYDFSKLEANGEEIGVDEKDPIEALTLFKKAATNSKYLKKVSTTKIYRGSTNGGGLEGKDGYLKLGTSKAQGQIVLTYAEGVKVTKVEIYCHDWYAKTDKYPTNSNTVSVNGSEGQLAPYNETGAVGMLTFELTDGSNVLTIDSNKRVFISKIVVYTEVSEEVNDGTGDMFGVVLTALVVSGMGITVLKKKEF